MEGMNYLTAGDLALHSQEMRGGGYDGYYGCHRSGKGMAATGIGLAAGLGGAALFGVLLAAWGFNNASQARAKVADNQYMVRVHLEGTIVYVPCDGNECCTKTQLISQDFSIPVASATAPTTVTVEGGTPVNAIVRQPCQKCSRTFVSEAPRSLTIA